MAHGVGTAEEGIGPSVSRSREWISKLFDDSDLTRDESRAGDYAGKPDDIPLPDLSAKSLSGDSRYDLCRESALELWESVAKGETERETSLNTRGAAVAAVAGIIAPIATALAAQLFTTKDPSTSGAHWAGFPRNGAEYLFIGALVCIVSAMAMAVAGVLRPGRGGQTKSFVGEAVAEIWLKEKQAEKPKATPRNIAIFRLDHYQRAIPAWHYRNRSKARWLRRAWMFLMIGIILIGIVGVIFVTELSPEVRWFESVPAIAISLLVVCGMLRWNLVLAKRQPRPGRMSKDVKKLGDGAKKLSGGVKKRLIRPR